MLTELLLLKTTFSGFGPKFESFLIQTPTGLNVPLNSDTFSALKLHGMSKQDPLRPSRVGGVVTSRAESLGQIDRVPIKTRVIHQTDM